MNSKHTPGNWYTQAKGGQPLVMDEQTGNNICVCYSGGGYTPESRISEEEAQANAKLIATAPEMLTALQMIMNATHDASYMDDAIKYVEQTIQNATA